MISVAEAKKLILQHSTLLPPVLLELDVAVGHFLADDIVSLDNIPAFNQAAMDGYAFHLELLLIK